MITKQSIFFLLIWQLSAGLALAADPPGGPPGSPAEPDPLPKGGRPAAVFFGLEVGSPTDSDVQVLLEGTVVQDAAELQAASAYLKKQVEDVRKENPDVQMEGLATYSSHDVGYWLTPGNETAAIELKDEAANFQEFATQNYIDVETNLNSQQDPVAGPALANILGKGVPVYRAFLPAVLSPVDGTQTIPLISTGNPAQPVSEAEAGPVWGAEEGEPAQVTTPQPGEFPSKEDLQARTFVMIRFVVAGITEAALVLVASGANPLLGPAAMTESFAQMDPETLSRIADISLPWIAAAFSFYAASEMGFQILTKRFRKFLRKSPTIFGKGARRWVLSAAVVGMHQLLLTQANLINFDLAHSALVVSAGVLATHGFYTLFAQDTPPKFLRGAKAIFYLAMMGNLGALLATFESSFNAPIGLVYLVGVGAAGWGVFFGSGGMEIIKTHTKLLLDDLRQRTKGFGRLCKGVLHKSMARMIELGRFLGAPFAKRGPDRARPKEALVSF